MSNDTTAPAQQNTHTPEQLAEVLRLHGLWLRGEPGGIRARLDGASLVGARLDGARLDGARLDTIRADFFKILDLAPSEVPGLALALHEGKIDGQVYEGDCACLIGTIANIRGCAYNRLDGLRPDSTRAAERWFLAIRRGCTPENHPVAKITARWIEEWQSAHPSPAVTEIPTPAA